MTPFRNDETNPFARQSPWPGMPQTVMRPTTTAAAGPPVPAEGAPSDAQPEPEPPPQPVTLIRAPIPQLEDSPTQAGPVAAGPMLMASAAARPAAASEPVVAAQPAAPPLDPAERLPKFRPLDEEETRIVRRAPQARRFDPELYDADIFASGDGRPLVSPIGGQRGRSKRERPARRELRLTPLLAAAAVGAGGTAALFLMVGLGRESALTAPKDPATSLAAGQLVGATPPALRTTLPSEPPATLTAEPPAALTAMTTPAAEPARAAAPRLAMARVVRARAPASRLPAPAAAAEPAHIDIPSPATPEPAPAPAAAPVQAAPPPAAVPFVRPPTPDAQAPMSRHVPDPG